MGGISWFSTETCTEKQQHVPDCIDNISKEWIPDLVSQCFLSVNKNKVHIEILLLPKEKFDPIKSQSPETGNCFLAQTPVWELWSWQEEFYSLFLKNEKPLRVFFKVYKKTGIAYNSEISISKDPNRQLQLYTYAFCFFFFIHLLLLFPLSIISCLSYGSLPLQVNYSSTSVGKDQRHCALA